MSIGLKFLNQNAEQDVNPKLNKLAVNNHKSYINPCRLLDLETKARQDHRAADLIVARQAEEIRRNLGHQTALLRHTETVKASMEAVDLDLDNQEGPGGSREEGQEEIGAEVRISVPGQQRVIPYSPNIPFYTYLNIFLLKRVGATLIKASKIGGKSGNMAESMDDVGGL